MRNAWPFTFALILCAAIGAHYLIGVDGRLERLEITPRADPREVRKLRVELHRIEAAITKSLDELERLRATGKRTAELDQRMVTLEGEISEASSALDEQRAKIAVFEDLREQVGPRALDERMEAFRRVAEDDFKRIGEVATSAISLAESTRLNLDHFEKNLARDKDRMWRELVGPTVQLMGEETVGSGVLLRSEPIAGTSEYRTYLLTAWHVIRDIQAAPGNADAPIPVTIYGQDHRIWPETAELLQHDATIDVALLKLNTTRAIECGARLAPRPRLGEVKIFEQVYAVGCPLGNDPIPTFGEIADTRHLVEGTRYWMISAPTYIGNSGGGIFDARTHELLGIFSKIYTHGTLRPTVVPHMGLVTSLDSIYDWLDRVGYAGIEELAAVEAPQPAEASHVVSAGQ